VESGVLSAVVARPIRRADVVIGRWLGLAVLVAAYTAASSVLEIAAVDAVSGSVPPHPILAVVFLAAQALVLLTLGLALGTRLASIAAGAICVVAFGLGWMAGVFAGIARFFDVGPLATAAEGSRWVFPSDGLWRGTVWALEPQVLIAAAANAIGPTAQANPFFATDAPPVLFDVWAAMWIVVVLTLAVWSLARRDI
jgi:ABC-type transport system involved in multi-copper enzyme maturation permease subunit